MVLDFIKGVCYKCEISALASMSPKEGTDSSTQAGGYSSGTGSNTRRFLGGNISILIRTKDADRIVPHNWLERLDGNSIKIGKES